MATAIHAGFLFWEKQDTPSNFSFFLVPPQQSNMMSDTADSIALSLKSSDGRGGIDSDDIRRLTKQKIFIPTTINELEHHLNHGLHILHILCGRHSYIVLMILGVTLHIKTNISTYCDMLPMDQLFAARVLFIVDIRCQNFFRQAQQGIFDTAPLDFTSMFQDIAQNRTFKASLPSCITNERKRKYDGNDGNNNHNNNNNNNNRTWNRNPHVNPDWKLKPNESFKDVFHSNRDRCPCRPNSSIPVCAKAQICGGCNEGCSYDHAKIDRGTTIHSKFNAFVLGCRRVF